MNDYMFRVTYQSHGTMIIMADSEEEAKAKAKRFECESDDVLESNFDDVDLDSCCCLTSYADIAP